LVSQYINWNSVFNIDKDIVSKEALLVTVNIVFIGIIMQLFFKLVTSVLYALQKSAINNFLTLVTSVITLLAVLIIPSTNNSDNMICMAIIHTLSVVFPLIVATIIVFCGKTLKKCVPSIKKFSIRHAKSVLSLGGVFLFVQVVYMIIMSTNEYLITFLCGNEAVVDYQKYYKLFSLVGTIFSLALTPIWSAVTRALTQKDFLWIKKLYKLLMVLSIVGMLFEICLIPILQIFMDVWLSENSIVVNYFYALAFALLGGLLIFNSTLSSIANGIGELKTQAMFFCIGAVIKIPIAWVLVKVLNSWIGVVWATVVALGIYCVSQPFTLKKHLKKLQERE